MLLQTAASDVFLTRYTFYSFLCRKVRKLPLRDGLSNLFILPKTSNNFRSLGNFEGINQEILMVPLLLRR